MTKNLKKYDVFVYILAILLLILIASFFPSTETTHSPETTLAAPTNSDNWQDNASYRDTSWSGSGTSGSPYLITSAQELAGLAYMVNSGNRYFGRYFRQTVNIDLSAHYWTPIGNDSNDFAGNYDGSGYTISDLYTQASNNYQGLFGYISGSSSVTATIKNVIITDSLIQGNQYVGGILGSGGIFSLVTHCHNNGIVQGTRYVGGIVGYNTLTVDYCYNTGNITGKSHVGGISGENSNGSTRYCYNNANINGNDYVGGISGWNNGPSTTQVGAVSTCYNSGNINGVNYVGGILGRANASIPSCYNIGNVNGSGDYIGGIVGHTNHAVRQSYNTGTVNGRSYVGGIVGYVDRDYITDTYNTGNVIGRGNYIGGIVGCRYNYNNSARLRYCYFGGNCTLTYGIGATTYSSGEPSSEVGSNAGCTKIINLNTTSYAKDYNWYRTSSNWLNTWRFNTWGIDSTINDGYPYLLVFYSYEIEYNFREGSAGSSAPSSALLDEIIMISNPNPSTGYRFIGWTASGLYANTAQHGDSNTELYSWSNTETMVTSTYFKNLATFASTVTLTANYEEIYNISYNYNGGSAGSLAPSSAMIDQVIQISTPNAPVNHVFAGWTASGLNTSTAQYGSSSSSLNSWTNGSTSAMGEYFLNLASPGSTITLTANWEEIQYDVQVNYNDGVTSNRTISDISYSTVFNVPNPTRTAYNFAGWSSSNKDDTALVGDSATSCTTSWTSGTTKATFFSKLTSTDGRTVILTANWEPKQYTITFDLDGGTGSTSMTYTINGNYTLPEPNKTGHTFTGWQFVSQSGEGNWSSGTYSAGTSLNGKYGNISLRATWRANTYTVTFDPQGGSVSPTTIQVTYGQPYGYHNNGVLPTPSRLDYNFETWATARFASGDYDSIFATDIYMIDGDSTLYAKWSTTWNIYAEKPEGNGTTASPYLISKPEHLGWLSYQVARGGQTTAVCKQTANINISQLVVGRVSPQWYPIGTLTYPFRGSYDGNGFNIWSGKYINVYTTNWGIFGCTNGAKLNRVYVTSSGDIDEDVVDFDLSIFQNTNIGGIIGYAWGSTTLTNCALSGRVATTINMTNKGALIGNATSSVTISDCVVFPLTTHDNSSLGISGGSPRIESCVYKINGVKGYTFTGYSDSTETNYVIVDYLSVPVPAGLSWLAYGGERATLAEIKSWANS